MAELKQSKPYAEQTPEERAADAQRWLDDMKAEWEATHLPKAQVFEFHADRVLSQAELVATQARIDAAWEQKLEADRAREREQAAKYGQYSHRGPGEPDWPGRQY
jgi:hypothetical protein